MKADKQCSISCDVSNMAPGRRFLPLRLFAACLCALGFALLPASESASAQVQDAKAIETHPRAEETHAILVGGELKRTAYSSRQISDSDGTSAAPLMATKSPTARIEKTGVAPVLPKAALITLAGQSGGAGNLDGPGRAARFGNARGMAVDKLGNIYVADHKYYTIRKIDPHGNVTTIAGRSGVQGHQDGGRNVALLHWPRGLCVDDNFNIYTYDLYGIRKIDPDGNITTLLEIDIFNNIIGPPCYSSEPAIAVDGSGCIFVATDTAIRRISLDGQVSTFVDASTPGMPAGTLLTMAMDGDNNIYMAKWNGVYKITPAKEIKKIFDDRANAYDYLAMSFGRDGNLYVAASCGTMHLGAGADSGPYKSKIFKISDSGTASTMVSMSFDRVLDPRDEYNFYGIGADASGNVYVVDGMNNRICRVLDNNILETFAGSPRSEGYREGNALDARFAHPCSVTVGIDGSVYIADRNNCLIRKLDPHGVVSTLAGGGDPVTLQDGVGRNASFHDLTSIVTSGDGNFYVLDMDYIRKVSPKGQVTTSYYGPPSPYTNNRGMALDYSGNEALLYGTHIYPGWQMSPINFITHVVRRSLDNKTGITILDDSFYAASSYRDDYPSGITADRQGNIYLADANNHVVRKIAPDGNVGILAGKDTEVGHADGPAKVAQFDTPCGLAADAYGNIFVADSGNSSIRRMNAATGEVVTVVGERGKIGGRDGLASDASLAAPQSIFIDNKGDGTIYITDAADNTVRVLQIGSEMLAQSEDTVATVGDRVVLEATASGSPHPSYQWFKNGMSVSGGTNGRLEINNVQLENAGDYSAIATNIMGSAGSGTFSLSVLAATDKPPPHMENDSDGGGGGAPTAWFLLLLVAVTGLRLYHYKHQGVPRRDRN